MSHPEAHRIVWEAIQATNRAPRPDESGTAVLAQIVDRILSDLDKAGLLAWPVDFGDQTCPACNTQHPGADCPQPDLFGD